jgi:NAD(P)-dependent dehydrogenase (short-subunit alcohol dehydrogenase family)
MPSPSTTPPTRLAADEVVAPDPRQGGTAITVQADVADEDQVLAMFAKVDAKLGRLTALVNNAGVVDKTSGWTK